ncbi:NmrA family protein, partial [cyanobacterium TDX16]
MTNTRTILLLGGTGKTARRIAPRLVDAGADVRTAARSGADVAFDWNDPSGHDAALADVDAVYLVPPSLRLDFVPPVTAFLDRAEAAGVGHVTFLSARGVDDLPPEVPLRAVELDLAARDGFTHSVLRPAWFMQNFSEAFFLPAILEAGVVSAPTGDGAEAFIHADDIADAAAATLLDPAAHDGAGYELTGPEALTFGEVAAQISAATGRTIV